MLLETFKNIKSNKNFNYSYKISRLLLPFILLIILFQKSYISIQPIKILFISGDKKIIFLTVTLSLIICFLLYFRWMLCLNTYNLKIKPLKLIQVNSEAFSIASLIPAQIGIDLLRIGKLRKIDTSKYKTKLLQATLLEKIFALLGQLFILFYFIFSDFKIKLSFILLIIISIYLLLPIFKKYIKINYIKKYIFYINYKNIYISFFYSIFCNFISCLLIFTIAKGLNMNYSFKILAISSTLSNISSVIPITPNGLGLSEFIFSEVIDYTSQTSNTDSVATIYFSYRIFLLLSHFLIYYIFQNFNLKKNKF
tara:strand:+ start:26200 stop:27129 length:930 start_codon:yes stop_codon:yes gene_type:complete